ncbi:MAG TPA: M48 family metalloprotease [Thermoanaerobaculia bacterium]|nr:M48 family metalloprotease [Thermoanaerobaculia bacterium]
MPYNRLSRTVQASVLLLVAGWSADVAFSAGNSDQVGDILNIGKRALSRPKFTDEDEGRMAQAQAQKFDAENEMWPEPLLETYLTGLVQKLVAVAKPRPFPYRVRVVSDPTLNAFTFGGGLLYVHAGLIARMENEAQLAMVLGHEIAHVTERHVTKGIEKAYTTQLLLGAAVTAGASTGIIPTGPALDIAYGTTMNAAINGHGRNQEREADTLGIQYMVKAGYDPREAPITFELLLMEYGDQSRAANFFYGSHPKNVERYETLSKLAKGKYAKDVKEKRLIVNTEEFKRVTRSVVIATGRLDYEQARFSTAQAMFEKAVRAWQDDPVPHYYLGKIALETGVGDGVDRALKHLEDAIKADAQYAPAYRELGLAQYRKGDRPSAIASLEHYLTLEPKAEDAKQIKSTIQELKRFSR